MGVAWMCKTFHENKRKFNISKYRSNSLARGIKAKIGAGLRML